MCNVIDFGCGSGADEQAALKSWFGWEKTSLLWSDLEWLQNVVVEVAAAGTSTCGYLVQEDTNDDFII